MCGDHKNILNYTNAFDNHYHLSIIIVVFFYGEMTWIQWILVWVKRKLPSWLMRGTCVRQTFNVLINRANKLFGSCVYGVVKTEFIANKLLVIGTSTNKVRNLYCQYINKISKTFSSWIKSVFIATMCSTPFDFEPYSLFCCEYKTGDTRLSHYWLHSSWRWLNFPTKKPC